MTDMANDESLLGYVAQLHENRVQRETAQRVQEIHDTYNQARSEALEAAERGDWDTAELAYTDALGAKRDWDYYNPPQQPQIDPRLAQFAKRNSVFLERYGPRAYEVLSQAHEYMMRPRNPSTTNPAHTGMGWRPENVFSPAYFDRLKSLLEIHGESLFGVKYDRNEQALTPNQAARISGLSADAYNSAARQLASQGRFTKR
jgi:hypothetical protein